MFTKDRVAGGALALFAVAVVWESRKLPLGTLRQPGPSFFPLLLALLLVIFGIVIAATGGRAEGFRSLRWKELPHAFGILAACIFSALALERLGYRLTVLLVLFFLLKVVEKKGWTTTALFAFVVSFGSFYLFYTLLRVPLPLGPWRI
ncbi:MAG TPA: tripartite tricarboxylate transporter TctB family protein [Candidatus Binatia bacterium]